MTNEKQALVGRLSGIVHEFGLTNLEPQIVSLSDLAERPETLHVAVFGRFKAGKSSLINHLLGDDLLPTGVIPVTSVLTTVRYGSALAIEVEFENGAKKAVKREEIRDYVAESENPHNMRGVRSVSIAHPNLLALKELVFVDTPGLGSALEHNTEVAKSNIPKIEVGMVAIGVDPPLSREDLVLIHSALRFTSQLALVITKIDLVSETEAAEVRDFVKSAIFREVNREIPTFEYSTRRAEYHKEKLVSGFLRPLIANRLSVGEEIFDHKIDTLAADIGSYLDVALAAAKKSDAERGEVEKKVLGEQGSFFLQEEEIKAVERRWAAQSRSNIEAILNARREGIISGIAGKVRGRFETRYSSLWRMTRDYEGFLGKLLEQSLSNLIMEMAPAVEERSVTIQQSFERVFESFRARIRQGLVATLGIDVKLSHARLEIDIPRISYVPLPRVFDVQIDLLSFLIPMRLFQGFFLRRFVANSRSEAERGLSRLVSQWSDAVNVSVDKMAKETTLKILKELEIVRGLLKAKPSERARLQGARENVERWICEHGGVRSERGDYLGSRA